MRNEPTPLRGHHLSRINAFDMDIREYGRIMVKTGYSEHESDSFVVQTYNFLQNLRQNSNLKVLVIAGKPDFICEKCPDKKKLKCSAYNSQVNILYNTIFWDQHMEPKIMDINIAKKAGLEAGKNYSVEEIIKATEEQTREFKASLENL